MELKKFLAIGEDKTMVTIEPSSMNFQKKIQTPDGKSVDLSLSVRLTDSEFPPYESVVPRSNDKICIVSRHQLLESVRRVSVLSSERYRTINIYMSENTATLRADYADVGDTEESIEVGYSADPINIGFNSVYVIQLLGAMSDESIEMKFGGELDGAIFKPVDREDFLGIVMPIRL
jgi:DNA polymerase-3 subunit beta